MNLKSVTIIFLLVALVTINAACVPTTSTGPGSVAVATPSTIPVLALPLPLHSGVGFGSGQVLAVPMVQAYQYLLAAYRSGEWFMESPLGDYLAFGPAGESSWWFLGISHDGAQLKSVTDFLGSNKSDTLTFQGLAKQLEDDDWQYVTPQSMPSWFATAIGSITAFLIRWGSVLESVTPVFIIMQADPTTPSQD